MAVESQLQKEVDENNIHKNYGPKATLAQVSNKIKYNNIITVINVKCSIIEMINLKT